MDKERYANDVLFLTVLLSALGSIESWHNVKIQKYVSNFPEFLLHNFERHYWQRR